MDWYLSGAMYILRQANDQPVVASNGILAAILG